MGRPTRDQPLLDLETIVETAMRVLNEEGLQALSMRRLARELNVAPGSLYHWVDGKDALLDAVYDRAVERTLVPPFNAGATPEEGLLQIARSFHAVWQANPGLVPLLYFRTRGGRMELVLRERLCVLLDEIGVPRERIPPLATALPHVLVGLVLAESRGEFGKDGYEAERALVQAEPESFPHVRDHAQPSADAVFEAAVAVLLGGIVGMRTTSEENLQTQERTR